MASSSPFFLNLLRENQNPHPLILMTDLKSETVLAMVDFFYHGETNVDEEEVKIFLAAAEELKIKGLASLDAQFKSQTNSKKLGKCLKKDILFGVKPIIKDEGLKQSNIKKHYLYCEVCDNCGKKYKSLEELNYHRRHCLDNKLISCNLCQKVFKGEIRMQIHKRRFHKDLLQCPECPIKVKQLPRHIKEIHTGEKNFHCIQCNKSFMYGDKLRSHIRSVHDKEKPYECRYSCGVRVSESGNRRKHEKQKHGQVWEGPRGWMVWEG